MTKYTIKVDIEVEGNSRTEAVYRVLHHLNQSNSSPLHLMPIEVEDVREVEND